VTIPERPPVASNKKMPIIIIKFCVYSEKSRETRKNPAQNREYGFIVLYMSHATKYSEIKLYQEYRAS